MTNIKFINRGDYFITLNTTPILVFYSMEEIEEFKSNHIVKIEKDKEIKEDIQQNKYCCPNEVVIKLWNAGYSFNDNNQSKVNYRGYKINRPTITDMAEVCYPRNWHFYFKTNGVLLKNDTLNFEEFLQSNDCSIEVIFWHLITRNIDMIL